METSPPLISKQVKILFNGWLFHSQICKWRDQPLWYQNKSKFFLTLIFPFTEMWMERSTPLISKQVKILIKVDISIHRNVNGEINSFDIQNKSKFFLTLILPFTEIWMETSPPLISKQVKILFNGWLFHSQKCKWRDQPLWYQNKSKFFLTLIFPFTEMWMERSTPLISKQVKILIKVDISIHRNVNGEINPFDIKTSQNSYQSWYFHSQKCEWRDQPLWYQNKSKFLSSWYFHSQKCKWRDQPLWYQNKSKFLLTLIFPFTEIWMETSPPLISKQVKILFNGWLFHSQKCKWRDQPLWYQNKSKFFLTLIFPFTEMWMETSPPLISKQVKILFNVDISIHRNVNGEINPFDIKTSQNSYQRWYFHSQTCEWKAQRQ